MVWWWLNWQNGIFVALASWPYQCLSRIQDNHCIKHILHWFIIKCHYSFYYILIVTIWEVFYIGTLWTNCPGVGYDKQENGRCCQRPHQYLHREGRATSKVYWHCSLLVIGLQINIVPFYMYNTIGVGKVIHNWSEMGILLFDILVCTGDINCSNTLKIFVHRVIWL